MVFKNQSRLTQITPGSTIRVIGDRASGKTTYLTALTCLRDAPDSLVKKVIPINDETENMIREAKECLEQKQEIQPTSYGDNGIEKSYFFKIEFKEKFPSFNSQPEIMKIECKDYPGEFFRDLVEKKNPKLLEKYIKDAVEATGILFLIDGTARRKDSYYASCLQEFLVKLDRLTPKNTKTRRIAVALTKCDLSELWIHTDNPKEKILARFEGVHGQLQNFDNLNVEYFATSAFGMLGSERETSNSTIIKSDDNGTRAVIQESDSKLWRPFGLIEPLYWLYTGKR
ncbi:TRAFAC clade GTPase domain-containing protein [Scytonema sp. NUACC26]|uniref:TRAFAC clade GTPase domain-containing protein n=1 Tax=Scytonema sp. NUACC26 TaxID=3140176 RepID=UPI0034DBCC1D